MLKKFMDSYLVHLIVGPSLSLCIGKSGSSISIGTGFSFNDSDIFSEDFS